eukprot:9524636-Karenia_brevis.AAC.1
MRVNQAYPEKEFASESGSIPSAIRDQAMHATNVNRILYESKTCMMGNKSWSRWSILQCE